MNIFYFFKELDTPMYQWQRTHFFDELERYGVHFITFNPLDYRNMDEANEKLVDVIKETPDIDLFMNCDDSSCLYPDTMKRVKHLGIPSLLICWDNLELPYKHKSIAPLFDVVWITSIETKYLFEKWGCKNIIFQSFAANPNRFCPAWSTPIKSVGFIGSPYGSRVNKINDLLEAEIKCDVYSNTLFSKGYNTSQGRKQSYDILDVLIKASRYLRFPIGREVLYTTIKNKIVKHSQLATDSISLGKHHSVSDKEMVRLYSDFALSLNITELRDTYIARTPIHKVHLRAFEIPMSGGLQFATYNEELASYFKEDVEIVLYRTKEEMIDKAKFYLNSKNTKIVLEMKKKARNKAIVEHTWANRFSKVFTLLNCQINLTGGGRSILLLLGLLVV